VKRYNSIFQAALLTTLVCLSRLISQAADGDVDSSFNPTANNTVFSIATQADGKILVGGWFTNIAGVGRNYIARLNADGTPDSGFNPNPNNTVSSIAVPTDGKMLIAGTFTSVGGTARNHIARLNVDGTLDSSFNPNANNNVSLIAIQADGKILIVGDFGLVGGTMRHQLARLNADGSIDGSFNPNATGNIWSAAVQADGKILIGGGFSAVAGTTRTNLARLAADGTVDSSFGPNPNGYVYCIAVQADGKILVGGGFSSVGGAACTNLARLNADGTPDSSFNPNANNPVYSSSMQTDGKILVGGTFTNIGGTNRNYVARLNSDGSVDNSFNPNADNNVFSIATQADGEVLIGGQYANLGGTARNRIARLLNGPAAQSLSVLDSTQVQWLRSGTAPEVEQAAFELSTDGGGTWTALGSGTRISGGWELGGLSLPLSGSIRARGRTATAYGNGSSGLIERVDNFAIADTLPPVLTCPPDVTVYADPGKCYATGVALGTPTASDNSGTVTVSSNAPAQFPLGTNMVIWTATDPSGNSNTCSQQVIVLESAPPAVTCPANMTVPGVSFSGTLVNFPLTLNGGCYPLTLSCVPPSGTIFPVGTTVVTATLVDGCGVSNRSSFTVTVLAPPVTLATSLSDGGMVLNWPFGVLQASDRVDGVYTNVPNATSPFTITPTDAQQYYYRVKVQ
jgi:uncharacterized delta-60 repeat protein